MEPEKIIQFILSPRLPGDFTVLKIAFIIFSLFLLLVVIILFRKASFFRRLVLEDSAEFFTYRPYGAVKIVKNWNAIMLKLDSGLESEYKLAVIEADSILKDVLSKMGYAGETLEEKLTALTFATLPNIDQLREVHHVRNNIVHDPDYKLSLDEARRILSIYQKALESLEVF